MLTRVGVTSARAFSTAPAAVSIDWASVRSKMWGDANKADVDKRRDAVVRREAAAASVGAPAEIDWAHYAKALPDLNVTAIKADYEAAQKAVPTVTYDDAADREAHESKEKRWEKFASYARGRVVELTATQAEAEEHKLHKYYRRSRVYQRYPGLAEAIHHKVFGTYDKDIWMNYVAWQAGQQAVPWDAAKVEAARAAAKAARRAETAAATGLTAEELGYATTAKAA